MPTSNEIKHRDAVLLALADAIRANERILLPCLGETSRFAGSVDGILYQFEGEDDLLHLTVARSDDEPLEVDTAQSVAGWLLPGLDPGLIWLRPGVRSHHFYFGHDDLVVALDSA